MIKWSELKQSEKNCFYMTVLCLCYIGFIFYCGFNSWMDNSITAWHLFGGLAVFYLPTIYLWYGVVKNQLKDED